MPDTCEATTPTKNAQKYRRLHTLEHTSPFNPTGSIACKLNFFTECPINHHQWARGAPRKNASRSIPTEQAQKPINLKIEHIKYITSAYGPHTMGRADRDFTLFFFTYIFVCVCECACNSFKLRAIAPIVVSSLFGAATIIFSAIKTRREKVVFWRVCVLFVYLHIIM